MKSLFMLMIYCVLFNFLGAQTTGPAGEIESRPYYDQSIETDSFQMKFMNMLFVLGLLIAFMLLASWMLKRMTRSRQEQLNASSSIKILESRSISAKTNIYVIEVQDQTLVIAESANGVQHIATLNSKS